MWKTSSKDVERKLHQVLRQVLAEMVHFDEIYLTQNDVKWNFVSNAHIGGIIISVRVKSSGTTTWRISFEQVFVHGDTEHST